MSLLLAALLAAPVWVAPTPAPPVAQEPGLYRVLNVRAAPGRLGDLIELQRERAALLESLGEHPSVFDDA